MSLFARTDTKTIVIQQILSSVDSKARLKVRVQIKRRYRGRDILARNFHLLLRLDLTLPFLLIFLVNQLFLKCSPLVSLLLKPGLLLDDQLLLASLLVLLMLQFLLVLELFP